MITDLPDTNAARIAAALVAARHTAGVPAVGMVLTLVVVADESTHYDAQRAALDAAREHPCRILVVIRRPGDAQARLDAEVRFLGDSGPGETVVMRMHGELADHAESVVLPLLLPDAPVVVWWPGEAPEVPGLDPIGRLARRRVTDAAAGGDPGARLAQSRAGYQPGDTDLSWTRITAWRTLLAALFDQPTAVVSAGAVECQPGSPSAEMLARWLELRLGVPIARVDTAGPGITGVRLDTAAGPLNVLRPDGRVATLTRPGQPDRQAALRARDTAEIVAEELRRLDPDEVYGEVLGADQPAQDGAAR